MGSQPDKKDAPPVKRSTIDRAFKRIDIMHDRIKNGNLYDHADKWGTFVQRGRWIVNTLLAGISLTLLGIVKSILQIFFRSYVLIIFLFYGIILWVLRTIVLWLALEVAKVSVLLAGYLDIQLTFMNIGFNALFDTVDLFMAFVNKDIIGLINDVAKILGLKKLGTIPFNGLRYVKISVYAVNNSRTNIYVF